MATADFLVSDMLVTVKSRELQRGMLAEMRGDPSRERDLRQVLVELLQHRPSPA